MLLLPGHRHTERSTRIKPVADMLWKRTKRDDTQMISVYNNQGCCIITYNNITRLFLFFFVALIGGGQTAYYVHYCPLVLLLTETSQVQVDPNSQPNIYFLTFFLDLWEKTSDLSDTHNIHVRSLQWNNRCHSHRTISGCKLCQKSRMDGFAHYHIYILPHKFDQWLLKKLVKMLHSAPFIIE